jgi:hypothetical protein
MDVGCFGADLSKPQPIEGVKVHKVEADSPIHESFGELGRADQWVDYERKPSRLGDTVWVIHSIKSDQGLKPVKVL